MHTEITLKTQPRNEERLHFFSKKLLKATARSWFVLAVFGQLFFAFYVFSFYMGSAISGNLEVWSNVLPEGIVSGDPIGNFALAGHLALAIIIMAGGPLQFVPKIQKDYKTFHRWNGKVYLTTAFITSIFGLYMVWTRGTVGGLISHIGITVDALLIFLFGAFALKYALGRKLQSHRKMALRLFMVVSAVWFYRIGLMSWLIINGGPVGIDFETFTGPFLSFLTFGQYMVPLIILELYFLAKERTNTLAKISTSVLIILGILYTAIGIFGAAMHMWVPRILS